MLPTVVSAAVATRVIFAHAVVLVILSLALVRFGLGLIYFAGAASGGAYFIYASWQLVRKPTVPQAWRVFAASIVQLGLLLTAAVFDRLAGG